MWVSSVVVSAHFQYDSEEQWRYPCLKWLGGGWGNLGLHLKNEEIWSTWNIMAGSARNRNRWLTKCLLWPVSVMLSMAGSSVGFVKGMVMEAFEPITDEMLRGSLQSGLRPHPLNNAHHSRN